MLKRGRGKAQIEKWRENHQILADLLIRSGHHGTTKMELHKGSGTTPGERLSRPTIDKHLSTFESTKEVIRQGRRFVWRANIAAAEAMRTRTINEAYKLMRFLKGNIEEKLRNESKDAESRTQTVEFELERFLNSNCITFIGEIPCTFGKSLEGMQSHLAFEQNLRKRHERELEKHKEEYMAALDVRARTKNNAIERRVSKKIEDEVGWTIGEYFKKLLKKAEKEEGIRKIMTVLGITDEMLKDV